MRKYFSILFFSLACSLAALPQQNVPRLNIDSLKRLLPFLKDTARINCLNELGFEFSDRYWSKSKYQQTDTAYMYTLQALSESQQLHY